MFDRLEDMLAKYEELMAELNDPQLALDQARYKMVMKEQASVKSHCVTEIL